MTILFSSMTAIAQQAPPPNPSEQALAGRLMKEINEGLACSAGTITLKAEVQRLEAKLKEYEIKGKPEDKKE